MHRTPRGAGGKNRQRLAGSRIGIFTIRFFLNHSFLSASSLAALPPLTRRYSRTVLIQRLRRLMEENLGYGLALEGLAAVEGAIMRKEMAGK